MKTVERKFNEAVELAATWKAALQSEEINPAALSDYALDYLLEVARLFDAKKLLEFGSGRSTELFLKNGYQVISIEDSEEWQEHTLKSIGKNFIKNLQLNYMPLQTRFLGGVPFKNWSFNKALIDYVERADIILIDSPYFLGDRIYTTINALKYARPGVPIILDDARVMALDRLGTYLTGRNESICYQRLDIDHGFGFYLKTNHSRLKYNHTPIEFARGFRRYFNFHLLPAR